MLETYLCRDCGKPFVTEKTYPYPTQCPGCVTAPMPPSDWGVSLPPLPPPPPPPPEPPKLHPMAPHPTGEFPPHLAELGDRLGPRRRRQPVPVPGWLNAVLLGGGVAAALVVGLFWLMDYTGAGFSFGLFASSGPGHEVRFLPDGCHLIATVDVQGLEASAAFKKVRAEIEPLDPQFAERWNNGGLAPSKVARVLVGGTAGSPADVIVVYRTRAPVTAEAILSERNQKYNESKEGNYTVFGRPGEAFCFPEPTLVVWSQRPESLSQALRRNSRPNLSRAMTKALDVAEFAHTVAAAVDITNLPQRQERLRALVPGQQARQVDRVEALALQLDAGTTLDGGFTLVCDDVKGAEAVAAAIREGVEQAAVDRRASKALHEALDTLHVNARGSKVTGGITVQVDPLLDLVRAVGQLRVPLPAR